MDQDTERRPPMGDFYFDNKYILDAIEARGGPLAEAALETLNSGDNALDLGSGSGMSTIALADLMEKLKYVTTVDMNLGMDLTILDFLKIRGINVTQNRISIQQYLDTLNNGTAFQVVMARAVRSSGLVEAHYKKLAEIVQPKGIILSLGDTRFPEEPLLKAGMEQVVRTGMSETVWIKR